MALYTTEVITILTAVSISTILVIYLFILRRNGWLGGASLKYYRCPNRECRKVFQKPVELKDLSVTPSCVYPACPHCGIDLEPLLASGIRKKLGFRITAHVPNKKTEIQIEDSAPNVENRKPETVRPTENPGKELPQIVEIKCQIATEDGEEPGETTMTAQPTSESGEKRDVLLVRPQQFDSQEKVLGEETATSNIESEFSDNSPNGCPYFFGYLRHLPKGSDAPGQCYSCPIMVDCYAIDRASIDQSLRTLASTMASETGK